MRLLGWGAVGVREMSVDQVVVQVRFDLEPMDGGSPKSWAEQ